MYEYEFFEDSTLVAKADPSFDLSLVTGSSKSERKEQS